MSKKEKIVLTEEQKNERRLARRDTAKQGFLQGFIPLLIQMAILALVICEFYFLIGPSNILGSFGKIMLQESVQGTSGMTNPSLVRFIYMWLSLAGAFLCLKWSQKVDKEGASFWISLVGGILLWQSIGECSWHFGLHVNGVFFNFPALEGMQGTFLLIPLIPLLLMCNKKGAFSWPVQIFILSFMCNWVGHYVLLGIAPMWPSYLSYHNPAKWPKLGAFLFGLHGSLMLLYRLFFKAKSKKERLTLSLALYTFIGMFIEGAFQVGASLE